MSEPDSSEARLAAFLRFCRTITAATELKVLLHQALASFHDLTGCAIAGITPNGDLPGLTLTFSKEPTGQETGPLVLPPDLRSIRTSTPSTIVHAGKAWQALHLPLPGLDAPLAVLSLLTNHTVESATWDVSLLEIAALLLAQAVEQRQSRQILGKLRRETSFLRDEVKHGQGLRPLTGESTAMKAVRLAIQRVAATDSTVLILGETGTGKELVARAIHQLSARRGHLFVAVNCAAFAPGVIASELFGHEQGAFTGATRRRTGRFELAQGGTLFLDEIGELSPEMQALLLRALQERQIERVGNPEPIAVNVRVIAATNRDLTQAMQQGIFRPDLFYRLNVFPISVPPLRQRPEDIPDLVRHFLLERSRHLGRPTPTIRKDTLDLLKRYPWPGNVRELENLIERALIVSTGEVLTVDPDWLQTPHRRALPDSDQHLAALERQAILDALHRCRGRIYGPRGAAAVLGLKPTTLYGKLRRHGIDHRDPSATQ